MGLFASFETAGLYTYADRLNLQSDRLYLAYAEKTDELSEFVMDKDDETESTGKADSYKLGDNSPFIREYKLILSYLDLMKYPDSNIFDTLTEEAVKKYQGQQGLEETGVLDIVTMDLLDGEEIVFEPGDTGKAIGDYQAMLATLGYLEDYTSETFDEATKEAVGEYQVSKDLEVTYNLDTATKDALQEDMLSRNGQ